jgi:hypothetical protein
MSWDTNQDIGVVTLTSYISDDEVFKLWTALSHWWQRSVSFIKYWFELT